ncbi:MAG TPA: helix-turn-helix domain-containing protein [Candidatus Coprenecus stercoravium]|uniref:Helix-turn-helix domain-containing protein n=1 Tax=Candidatus Coprenecus stercoravium TaxID=2840735 RepID=A0A9D2GRZ9_9BACT|nr:helix-turn-helix domain-containing protein [Candidatus Coprenecus stercoravium]
MKKAFFSDTPEILYKETDMADLVRNPCRFGCDVQIVCTRGSAEISTGIQSYNMRRGVGLFFLGGGLVQAVNPSPDFTVRMLLYPKEVMLKALLPLDTDFLNYLHEYPCFDHLEEGASEQEWYGVMLWMDMAALLFSRSIPRFRRYIEQNFVQSMLMCLYNSVPLQRRSVALENAGRQMLCHQFVRLIRENSTQERMLSFYAGKLGISSRYLSDIVAENFDGKTPKQLIDAQLTAEIKVQLDNPELTVGEIAHYFNFPDHTSMSRFFKRNTGMSPKEYRTKRKTM